MSYNPGALDFDYWGVYFTSDMMKLALRTSQGEIRFYSSDPKDSLEDVEATFATYVSGILKLGQESESCFIASYHKEAGHFQTPHS